jgi:hypothetical protein
MRYSGPKDKVDAARDPSTSAEELETLSSSEYVFVREAVASNSHTPTHTLNALVPIHLESEDDFRVASALLKNPHLPPEACVAIISRTSEVIGAIGPRDFYPTRMIELIYTNEVIPLLPLCELVVNGSFPKHLRGRIARKETRKEVLLILTNDKNESVRKRATSALEIKKMEHAEP